MEEGDIDFGVGGTFYDGNETLRRTKHLLALATVLDDQGMVEEIIALERNVAHRIIEEFMLVANETVAQYLSDNSVPSLYRVHEDPDPLKVEQFEEFVSGTPLATVGTSALVQAGSGNITPAASAWNYGTLVLTGVRTATGNLVAPAQYLDSVGADSLRLYHLFVGPPADDVDSKD